MITVGASNPVKLLAVPGHSTSSAPTFSLRQVRAAPDVQRLPVGEEGGDAIQRLKGAKPIFLLPAHPPILSVGHSRHHVLHPVVRQI